MLEDNLLYAAVIQNEKLSGKKVNIFQFLLWMHNSVP